MGMTMKNNHNIISGEYIFKIIYFDFLIDS